MLRSSSSSRPSSRCCQLRGVLGCISAAATEPLLRRSCCCDGVAAATELRRLAPSRSFCASRLDALNEEPAASFSLLLLLI